MAITINEATKAATVEIKYLTGKESEISVANGKTLVIETTPGGVEFLSRAPAAGKKWVNGEIRIHFEEVDI